MKSFFLRSKLKLGLAALISVVTMACLVLFLDKGLLTENPVKSWFWLFVGCVSYLLNILFRAVRLNRLYQSVYGTKRLLWIVVCGAYSSINFFLPMRIGEISLPLLIQKVFGEKVFDNLPLVAVLRVVDLMALLLLAFAGAAYVGYEEWAFDGRSLLLVAICVFTIGVLVVWHRTARAYVFKQVIRIKQKISGSITYVGLTSLAISFVFLLQIYATLVALGGAGSIGSVISVFVFSVLVRFVPADGLVNIGSHHLAWFSGLTLAGIAHKEALGIAIFSHFLFVLFVIIGTLATLVIYLFLRSGNKVNETL